MRAYSLCAALLVLDLVYCTAALFVPGLPGWKMFESSERATYKLTSARGESIDAYAFVPRSARALDDDDLVRVARFICMQRREWAPLKLEMPKRVRTFDAPDCVDHATH